MAETVAEAKRCFQQGAAVLHAHVRDGNENHVLDPGLYHELFDEMKVQVPEMLVQMTTEAVGRYSPNEQAECVYRVGPRMISMAVREMAPEGADLDLAKQFYLWTQKNRVHVQHIVFDTADLERLYALQSQGVVPHGKLCALFVLGRFSEGRESIPEDIEPFLNFVEDKEIDWFVCAFGGQEHACALQALKSGGHARVGFENNLLLANGDTATHSADLVMQLKAAADREGIQIATAVEARSILGVMD
ncbi:MAG: 3-keto-5-aminohexanoate cleavage protein [bacterium]